MVRMGHRLWGGYRCPIRGTQHRDKCQDTGWIGLCWAILGLSHGHSVAHGVPGDESEGTSKRARSRFPQSCR
jgi:hypothetical protein